MSTLLNHLQGHLAARGIVRRPKDTATPTLPPLFLEPRTGTPAPGDLGGAEGHPTIALGLFRATGIGVAPYESWFYRPVVELYYRLRNARDLESIEVAVRGELEDRRAWTTTTGLYVIESGVWRETAPIGRDERVFTYMTAFRFQLYTGRAPRDG